MRNRRLVLIAFATLVPLSAAARQAPPTPSAPTETATQTIPLAQTTPPTQTPPTGQTPPSVVVTASPDTPSEFVPKAKNVLDFGMRGTWVDGDASRYQRYRDLRSGPFLDDARYVREHNNWLFDVGGEHIGWADQRYKGTAGRPGLFKAWGLWDQIPLHMSETTETLFVETISKAPPTLTVPDDQQALVQAGGTTALAPLFDAKGIVFNTESWRHIAQGGAEYLPNQDFTLRSQVQVIRRKGVLPYGGSWGHSSLVEIPAPIDFRTTDFETNGEFSHGPLLARASFSGSWFNNANTAVTFDNPFRLTDAPSTPARGRSSLAPSNSFVQVNGMASVRFAGRSRATAYVSTGSLKDAGDLLMPQTINTSITGLVTPLPRTAVEGAARTNAVNLTFVSHPSRWFDVDARYRLYDYDNRTPDFVMPQRVSYDNTPAAPTYSTLGGATSTLVVETEPFGVKRHTFDATVRVPAGTGTAGAGYSFLGEDRTHRFFESTSENVLRLSYDLVGTGLVTVRSKYEHGAKRGDVTEESQRELFGIGEQPEMRHFDIASRDRDRVTILASAAPAGAFGFNGSMAVGKDDYIESSFGLRDNTHRIYSGGTEWVPSERVSLGGSYSYERYVALLHSRQASPPAANAAISYETFVQLSSQPSSTVQVADATRNWGSDGTDRVHSLIVHADFLKLAEKWDVHINYDFNHSQSLYTYTTGPNVPRTLPEDTPPPTSSLPDPSQLPLVRSELQRGSADLIYALTSRLGIGVSYWYEQYRVQDFTLDADANQDLVRAGPVLLLGYMYRPYTANTVWARMIYRW